MNKDHIPFNALIVGPTGCGKTQFIVEQLLGPFRYQFDYIVLLCPTYVRNKTWDGIGIKDEDFYVDILDPNNLSSHLKFWSSKLIATATDYARRGQGYKESIQVLLILDDIACGDDVKKRTSEPQPNRDIPAPKYVPRPSFDVSVPNDVHQADLLFLPHDTVRRKTYRHALTVVDIASRYKDAEPVTSKDSTEVADAFIRIYKRTLKWHKLLQVDAGKEFMGAVTKTLNDHETKIRRAEAKYHRGQAIVERFNRTLAERLFGYQYWKELEDPSKSNREWTQRLPDVISSLNNETTRVTGIKPKDAIKKKEVTHESFIRSSRVVGKKERKKVT